MVLVASSTSGQGLGTGRPSSWTWKGNFEIWKVRLNKARATGDSL
jgi:hypothetical protein